MSLSESVFLAVEHTGLSRLCLLWININQLLALCMQYHLNQVITANF